MYIQSIRIKNYKSYRDSGEIPLGQNFSVIVGKNDSGKSAFLEALSLAHAALPHRSIVTARTADTLVPPDSVVEMTTSFSREEVEAILSKVAGFTIPAPPSDENEFFLKTLELLDGDVSVGSVWVNGNLTRCRFIATGEFEINRHIACTNTASPNGVSIQRGGSGGSDAATLLVNHFRPRIYAFRAERLNVGQAIASGNPNLNSDASNLADVLNRLISGNRARFDRLLGHMRTVFPHITEITVPVVHSQNAARVVIWGRPSEEEREDLAVPLVYSGTGIGQVLAMLYVVVTADSSRVLIIDEPQSFLHPGAFRKLLEILRQHTQHQYIISSHAPLALDWGQEHILLARRVDQETQIVPIDAQDQVGLRTFLSEVGARLSDVFGSDAILWVEGKTEETCFPELIRELAKTSLRGVQILGVVSTDELGARQAERVFDIYSKLSNGPTLMPPALQFVFDREGRTQQEMEDLSRKSKGLVVWLKRRMYENYLVDPNSIAMVLSQLDGQEHTAEEVENWIRQNGSTKKFLVQAHKAFEEEWYQAVHAGKLLQNLFAELTNSRVCYQKVNHGLLLTQKLIEKPTTAIQELANWLAQLVRSETDLN
jgi:AAA ATPase domain/AAA domain, putative AbiEii toxin, Type IV TA system